MDKIIINESVRSLVEFCLLKGDIDNRFTGSARAVEGTRAHQKLQEDNNKIYETYEKEVKLSIDFDLNRMVLKVEGRADGIIDDNGRIIIEEIKSTYKKFSYIDDSNEVHWAQAKFYGYIYALQNNMDSIYIRLSYVQLDNYEVKSFEREFTFEELKEFTYEITKTYEKFSILIMNEKEKRNISIKNLKFPFEKYREGQRKLTNTAYFTIKEGETLFAQAPTGIGKTISTIFPAVKALGENLGERIVYLTPKTINRQVAEDTYNMLRGKGLSFKSITLTAKEKSCCNTQFDCNPDACEYAQSYYDKVRPVITEILKNEQHISKEILQEYAQRYKVCPFELSLDVSMYCDGIICDYNYMFDPRANLTRLIESSGNIVLVDEAHNLVDRSRMMYSARLSKHMIMDCKKIAKGKLSRLHGILNKINSYFIGIRNECDEREVDWFYEKDSPEDLVKHLNLYIRESEEILLRGNKFEGYDEILNLYFEINRFISMMQLYDENYVTCIEKESQEVTITIYCVNPSKNLKSYLSKFYSTIFFSATLSPIRYYVDILGGNNESYRMKLPSPFKKENLKVLVSPINIRYKHRKRTLKDVASKVCSFVKDVPGNYMIFSPSYAYMNLLWEEISKVELENYTLIKQETSMTEEEKEQFLMNFKENRNVIGFCVIGGMFSEGVDLPGENLIGAVIIGVGYPKIDTNNEIIREFYGDEGYDYSYVFPGINKVLQGAGRVIRTENDKGRILLIDDRYITEKYSILLPNEWYPMTKY
ncbi:MAG: helicase C-terminal domain-containing protein [Clostridium sp.]|nr:helicase C-terminal domain-containing protein [Clostridium sp.]